jgi:hypothetical protein
MLPLGTGSVISHNLFGWLMTGSIAIHDFLKRAILASTEDDPISCAKLIWGKDNQGTSGK